ncbi:hypothetical protein [Faecalibacter sp. LW9]|uniref:hypothetical protein n=1 Tax=Faecalibacter sp. LW9 TaxID=3103144 RepID=UPI002AFF348B|nr:hypothetical protein [Faecalibacter sp. LW9]
MDPNFVPDSDAALHVDGKLNVRGNYKAEGDTPPNISNTGEEGQILQIKNGNPTWVNSPVSLLEEGMYYIENTYTNTSSTGTQFSATIVGAVTENEIFNTLNGWKKIVDFKESNVEKNFNILEEKNNINILIETGLQLTSSSTNTTIDNSQYIQYVCGLFSKEAGLDDNTAKLKAYRLGQISGITGQSIHHSNFNMLYTLKNFPLGNYNFFVGCKKINQTNNNLVLNIGSASSDPSSRGISQFTDRPIVKLDILYQF